MRTYTYKNIVTYEYYGGWDADYVQDGKRFALHRCGFLTKKEAYEEAKQAVDYLNRNLQEGR